MKANTVLLCVIVAALASVSLAVGTCPTTTDKLFENLPDCANTTACSVKLCQCVGASWNTTTKKCENVTDTCTSYSVCMKSYIGCLTNASEFASDSLSNDVCQSWGAPIKMGLLAYAVSPNNFWNTSLYRACSSASCGLFTTLTPSCNVSAVPYDRICVAPDAQCVYTCPDSSCAQNLSACVCTEQAAISGDAIASENPLDNGKLLGSVVQRFSVSASYRATQGPCTHFNFLPFLKFEWTLLKNGSPVPLGDRAFRSTLVFEAKNLTVGATYTLSAKLTALTSWRSKTVTFGQFTVVAPAPSVSLHTFGTERRTSPTNIRLPASITDAYADGTNGTWACVFENQTACPASVQQALAAATNTGVTLAGPVPAATYIITLTYKGVSSSVKVVVVADPIPTVGIRMPSGSFATPNKFLATQSIVLAAVVDFNGTTTLEWTVGGTVMGSGSTLTVNSTVVAANTVTQVKLRAAVVGTDRFGEGSVSVEFASPVALTVDVVNMDNATGSLLALTDRAKVEFNSAALASPPFGGVVTVEVGYVSAGTSLVEKRLTGTQATVDKSGSFVTALPDTGATATTFFARLLVNGLEAAYATKAKAVRTPSRDAAISSQTEALKSTTDPDAVLKAASALSTLSVDNSTTAAANKTETKGLVDAVMNALKTTVKSNAATMSSSQTASLFVTLTFVSTASSTAETNKTAAAAFTDEVTSILEASVSSATFDVANAESLLKVVDSVGTGSAGAANVVTTLLTRLEEKAEVGKPVTIETPKVSVVVIALPATAASEGTTVTSSKASIDVPKGALATNNSEDIVALKGSTLQDNPYASNETTDEPAAPVAEYSITVNGQAKEVRGLEPPIVIKINTGSGDAAAVAVCRYFEVTSSTWSTDGVQTRSSEGAFLVCATTHLTAFSGFASSAVHVVLSAAVVCVAALLQLVL